MYQHNNGDRSKTYHVEGGKIIERKPFAIKP